ncbi:MAG TPA: DUF4251 domain-containing protein [Bacteroidales bacterium]|nr:DUF4251 domain-containing protein [Bacteroidales bacterium]
MKTIYLLFAFIILTSITISAQKNKSDSDSTAVDQGIKNIIESREYEFNGTFAHPTSGGQIDLFSTPNYLIVNGDSASADLPFYGEAYVAGYGQENGIVFDNKIKEYKSEDQAKKKQFKISFQVSGKSDNFHIYLFISYNGYATLSINSNNKAPISYVGKVKGLK